VAPSQCHLIRSPVQLSGVKTGFEASRDHWGEPMHSGDIAKLEEPFAEFTKTQTQLNYFFWSSELSYALVRQKLIKSGLSSGNIAVTAAFTGLDPLPHAFVHNMKEAPKYREKLETFDEHLGKNLEPLSRYVIMRFHTALEHFLHSRMEPFIDSQKMPKDAKAKLRNNLKKCGYHVLQAELEKFLTLRCPIPEKEAIVAQMYRLLRNSIVHSSAREYYDAHWPHELFLERIQNTEIFTEDQKNYIAKRVTRKIADKCAGRKRTPPLFFYALFMFTDYRNFATSVEAALPLAP
jgi:hypothetical protein